MNGRTKQAKDITQVTMPKGMADAIQPFMDRMPRLTAAQRAAAVHYGSFPSGAVQMAAAAPRTDTSAARGPDKALIPRRSEEHTSELQSLMRISYAVFCLNKKTKT